MKKSIKAEATKHKFLYWYFIISSLFLFFYTICIPVFKCDWRFILSPFAPLVGVLLFDFIKKTAKLVWMYVSDKERGLLMLRMDEWTIWNTKQKVNVAQWVYPRKLVRGEEWDAVNRKLHNKKNITEEEKKILKQAKGKPIRLTHDPQDGTQRLTLISILIYADNNIKPLDKVVRDRFELTDENMAKFNLEEEIKKLQR